MVWCKAILLLSLQLPSFCPFGNAVLILLLLVMHDSMANWLPISNYSGFVPVD
ncbi:hypothetical protein L873DRAFT_1799032 [Choiromyces venosus 120613-1]|uniref:Uncharacterized protein n=1 Tax=Choiromyces venosus 120613-1 TaxID=1336337 RepID=A0A3N4K242_9PEZI|nr:hypothetical protein L873DRAFT_1799032 [Choiromyces venosus 120613-1]